MPVITVSSQHPINTTTTVTTTFSKVVVTNVMVDLMSDTVILRVNKVDAQNKVIGTEAISMKGPDAEAFLATVGTPGESLKLLATSAAVAAVTKHYALVNPIVS